MSIPSPTISYLTDIYFVTGMISALPSLLADAGIQRPLVVTDRGLVDTGMVSRLRISRAAVFDDVESNPTEQNVLAGAAVFRGKGCDGIVALGGGSPLDCAKAVGLMTTHSGTLESYAYIRGGMGLITPDKPPLIAVPTTAGTGSEVGRAALITFSPGSKLAIISRHMLPNKAVCDPELTLDLPPRLTAATGMDAISHCVETYLSPKFNPVADSIALDGLGRACRNLARVVRDGCDLEARSEMMMAALEGALAFQKGLGVIHSLSHPLGSLPGKRLHHGTLNAVFLPHVLRFNRPACPEKMQRMAEIVGVGDEMALPAFFEQLLADVGLPRRLRDLGVTNADLEPMIEPALNDHSTATNPRPVTADDCRMLFDAAL